MGRRERCVHQGHGNLGWGEGGRKGEGERPADLAQERKMVCLLVMPCTFSAFDQSTKKRKLTLALTLLLGILVCWDLEGKRLRKVLCGSRGRNSRIPFFPLHLIFQEGERSFEWGSPLFFCEAKAFWQMTCQIIICRLLLQKNREEQQGQFQDLLVGKKIARMRIVVCTGSWNSPRFKPGKFVVHIRVWQFFLPFFSVVQLKFDLLTEKLLPLKLRRKR